jgi:flagellar export protein FliJ
MSKPWEILGKLAEKKSEDARKTLAQIDQLIARVEQRRSQVQGLINENLARLNSPDRKSMNDIRVVNMFLQNLTLVMQGLDHERQVLTAHRQSHTQKFREAKQEEQKMDSLQEREIERERLLSIKIEQQRMDATAIAQFNGRKR